MTLARISAITPDKLWELMQVKPEKRLLELIEKGEIYSGMTREEAIALKLDGTSRTSSKQSLPLPTLQPELATLLDACILLGGAELVICPLSRIKARKG